MSDEQTTTNDEPVAEETIAAKRVFKYQDNVYDDPGTEYSVEDVKKHLAQYFPELGNATHSEKTLDDGTVEIVFAKKVGTKGARPHRFRVSGVATWEEQYDEYYEEVCEEIAAIVEAYTPGQAETKALALHADEAYWDPDVPPEIEDLGEIPEDEWMRRIGQPELPLEMAA